MLLKLTAKLNTFKDGSRFSCSDGEILSSLIEELNSYGIVQYIYNGYTFAGLLLYLGIIIPIVEPIYVGSHT